MKKIIKLKLIILLIIILLGSAHAFWTQSVNSPDDETVTGGINIGTDWNRGVSFPNVPQGIRAEFNITLPTPLRRLRFSQTSSTAGVISGSQTFTNDIGIRILVPTSFDLVFFVDANYFNKVVEYNLDNSIRAVTVWQIGMNVPSAVWNFWS